MDFHCLSFDLNMGFVHDFLNVVDESDSIVTQIGKSIRLEQSLQRWKEGLKVFEVQGDPSSFGYLWSRIKAALVLRSLPIVPPSENQNEIETTQHQGFNVALNPLSHLHDCENPCCLEQHDPRTALSSPMSCIKWWYQNKMNFQLRKFNMEMITDRCEIDSRKSPMIVVIGKKDTGKSFLVRDILFTTQRHFPVGTVISATEVANEFFQNMVPSKFIHDKYRPEIVQNVIKRQATLKTKRNTDKAARGGSSSIDPRAFLILDDCLYDAKSWINEESTRFVFMNGRHIDLMTIITMQYPLGITPNLRTNVDFIFILRENILGNRRRIYENYAGMFPTFDMFCTFMDQCTENYEGLVICNNVSSNKLEDQVFWYKASDHPPFKLCDPSLWVDNRPFQSAMLSSDDYNPMNMRKKNEGPSVWVKKTDTR